MNMQIIIAIVCVGLLMWADTANAQRPQPQITFRLTVGVHDHETVSADRINEILKEASKVLSKCNVILKRKGAVGSFMAPNTVPNKEGLIDNEAERDAVHKVNFDVKVVEAPFFFCRGPVDTELVMGCSFDPLPGEQRPQRKSMIVSNPPNIKLAGKIWAHEFGHKSGLKHRNEGKALMRCLVKPENDEINDHECDCIRNGPGSCGDPVEPPTACNVDNIR
jgi:hypothetical protein